MDEVDEKILKLLQRNARISIRKMAKILGLSPANISRRIKRLEEKGIIRGYVAITDNDMLGANCSLLLLISVDGSTDPDMVCHRISEMPDICLCLRSTGQYDIVALADCSNPKHISDLLRRIREVGGIRNITTSLIIDKYKVMQIPFKIGISEYSK